MIADKRFLDHSKRVVNPLPPQSHGVRISDAVDKIGGGGGEGKKKKQKAYRRSDSTASASGGSR